MLCTGYGAGRGSVHGAGYSPVETNPSPGSHLSMQSGLSHKGERRAHVIAVPIESDLGLP